MENDGTGSPPAKRQREIEDEEWVIPGSRESHECLNAIRICSEINFQDALEIRNKDLELLNISLGTQ